MEQVRIKNLDNDSFLPEIRKLLNEGRSVTLRTRGWSMRPFIEHDRDLVRIAPCDVQTLCKGDVVLAQVEGGVYVVHRIIQVEGDALVLQGDGNVGTTEYCRRSEVLGKIVGFYRKGRQELESVEGKKWQLYSRFWLWLTPVRRYLLAFYRRVYLQFFKPL